MHDISQTYVRNMRNIMMQRITLRLPEQQISMLQQLVDSGEYPNVSEAVGRRCVTLLKNAPAVS